MSNALRLLVVAFVLLAFAAPARALRPGDLLALLGSKVVRVDPGTGSVSDFSPRNGSGTNLLSDPHSIAADAEGEIFVIDAGKLIAIDRTTGTQSVVRGYTPQFGDFDLDLGNSPYGVEVSAVSPSGLDARSIFVGSLGAVYEVSRSATFGTGSSVFSNLPAGWENYNAYHLSTEDLGGGTVDAWVGSFRGVLGGTAGAIAQLYYEPNVLTGMRHVGSRTFVSRVAGFYCTDDPGSNGIYELAYQSQISAWVLGPFALGGDLTCPGPIAATEQPFALYVVDTSITPNRIVKVTGSQNPQTSIAATMPSVDSLHAIAVYTPEPGPEALEASCVAALLACSAARRRSHAVARSSDLEGTRTES